MTEQSKGQRIAVTVMDLSLGIGALAGGIIGLYHKCDTVLPTLLVVVGALQASSGLVYALMLVVGENFLMQGALNLLGLGQFGVFVACNVLLFKSKACFEITRIVG